MFKLREFIKISVHKDLVIPGDLIEVDGKMRTVSQQNIKNDSFMGRTIFGNSYAIGYQPVTKFIFQ